MKVVKLIELTFANTQTTTKYVNIPYKVSKIIVKQISYINQNSMEVIVIGGSYFTSQFTVISSDIVEQNQPLGIVYDHKEHGSLSTPETTFESLNPRNISGHFTFTLNKPTVNGGTDRVQLLIEFHK